MPNRKTEEERHREEKEDDGSQNEAKLIHAPNYYLGRCLRTRHVRNPAGIDNWDDRELVRTLANMNRIRETNTEKVCWYRSWYCIYEAP
jgi:hypothetical protein